MENVGFAFMFSTMIVIAILLLIDIMQPKIEEQTYDYSHQIKYQEEVTPDMIDKILFDEEVLP